MFYAFVFGGDSLQSNLNALLVFILKFDLANPNPLLFSDDLLWRLRSLYVLINLFAHFFQLFFSHTDA